MCSTIRCRFPPDAPVRIALVEIPAGLASAGSFLPRVYDLPVNRVRFRHVIDGLETKPYLFGQWTVCQRPQTPLTSFLEVDAGRHSHAVPGYDGPQGRLSVACITQCRNDGQGIDNRWNE